MQPTAVFSCGPQEPARELTVRSKAPPVQKFHLSLEPRSLVAVAVAVAAAMAAAIAAAVAGAAAVAVAVAVAVRCL